MASGNDSCVVPWARVIGFYHLDGMKSLKMSNLSSSRMKRRTPANDMVVVVMSFAMRESTDTKHP